MPGNVRMPSTTTYLRIVGGDLVQKVEKGTENARCREWESKDGKSSGSVHELVFTNWTAKVLGYKINKEGKFGDECIVQLEDAVLTLPVGSRFFSDFAKKIHNADLKKAITFHPFNFEPDEGEGRVIGMKMYQGDKDAPLKDYFWDGKKALHDMPEADKKKTGSKSYWPVFFMQVSDFLTEKLEDVKFPEVKAVKEEAEEVETVPTDLPWEGEEEEKKK